MVKGSSDNNIGREAERGGFYSLKKREGEQFSVNVWGRRVLEKEIGFILELHREKDEWQQTLGWTYGWKKSSL